MKFIIQIIVGLICALGTLGTLYFMATSELNYQDQEFGKYFGILGVMAGVAFIVLTQNNDNEETNPGKEKLKK